MKKEYKIGDFVYAKARPTIILVVRQYVRKFYYCTIKDDPSENELIYFDRELKPYKGC